MTDKLDLQSTDIASLNIEKIATLFPNCVTETAEGKKIDFDLLKQELSTEIVEGNKERYRLEWPGKRESIVTANLPTTNTLRPVREDSVDFDSTENIYIEGDNLEVLKLLQESYLNKIKMIYIDPPYNTGNDFVYKDNFAKAGEEELFESGQKDEYNQRLVANPETNGRYHSDWLSMMYPRLKLARNLLTEDGVIFISIDDNEVHNLRKICDEIFGGGNFVSNFLWRKKTTTSNVKDAQVSAQVDSTICYRKTSSSKIKQRETSVESRSYPERDPEGNFRLAVIEKKDSGSYKRDTMKFPIMGYLPREGKRWQIGVDTAKELEAKNRFIWDGEKIKLKIYDFEDDNSYSAQPNLLLDKGTTDIGAKEVNDELFGISELFDNPKPTILVNHLLSIGSNSNDIILDFFSGSATTAHAIIQLNAEDASSGSAQVGKRKYIMVQLPEATDEKSEAYKAGYKNICEIGKERIRRASHKIKEEKIEKAKKDGLFAEFKDHQDYGFRVYRLDSSNMQDVYYKPQDYSQGSLDLFADNVKEGRTAEDLLTQIMLDWGLPLSLPIERKTISGKEVYAVAGDSLYCCFDDGIDEAFAKEIAQEKPLRIVFRDKGFKDDTAKENVKQLLKQLSSETEMRVI